MWNIILPILLFLTSIFLILLVLIQRGRGGGLAGAFGGLGGQSAFGTKAGDLFTRITIGVATFWIILCAFSVLKLNNTGSDLLSSDLGGQSPARTAPSEVPAGTPAADGSSPAGETSTPAAEPAAAPAAGATETPAPEAAPETTAPDTPAPENKE